MAEQNKQTTEHNFKLGDKLYETPKEREDLAKGEINIKDVEEYKKYIEKYPTPVKRFFEGKNVPEEDVTVTKSEEI